jgi:superfamily II DNA or RNA helicase
MLATLYDNQWIHFSNITDHEEDMLWKEFSVVSPGREYIDPSQLGRWDGVFRKYNRSKRKMARPLLSMLRGVCKEHDLPLVVDDKRDKSQYSPMNPDEITLDFLPGITLDPHQLKSIQVACKIECGVFDIPTGGGKGEIIAGICKAIDCPTVIVADQKIVIDQLKSRLELRDIADEIGLFYAGHRPNGETIVVGSIQSLAPPKVPPKMPTRQEDETNKRWLARLDKFESSMKGYKTRRKNAKQLQQYVKDAHMILVDECDKATSDPYKLLFRNWFKGQRRYGFSGTPFDKEKPVEALVMQEHLGSVIMQESRRNLEQIGRIIPTEYIMMAFGMEGSISDRSAYDIAYDEWMINNGKFHKLIAGICQMHVNEGTLILVDREVLGHSLERELTNIGIESYFIYGKTPKRRRDEVLRAFEKREFNVLIGGKIINRGLDLDGGCENLIIATGGKLRSDFVQKVGRALRHNKRGKSRVYDFFFRCNKYLYGHSKARLKTMVDFGYESTIVFKNGSIDGGQLIKSRFRIPKRFFQKNKTLF